MLMFILLFLTRSILFGDKFGPQKEQFLVWAKIWYLTNSNMKDSMLMFIFSVFDRKNSFSEQIWSKKSKLFIKVKI